jgi:single-stranded-DNA-specific exonuclease
VLLADAIAQQRRICVVADYDCDGATACAVALRGLAMLGAAPALGYVVPDRAVHGYGLTPAIVDLALQQRQPQVLVTVDNGIASLAGVAHARALGLQVLVTDHHLPALEAGAVVLPAADVIVNPNQPGCSFASKALAGVGVMFYVLLATRAELRARGAFRRRSATRLDTAAGPGGPGHRGRRGEARRQQPPPGGAGPQAHPRRAHAAGRGGAVCGGGRDPRGPAAFDFGFALGPRINAAGRLADMTLGIECLLTDDPARAAELATQLDAINRERREVEAGMREQAEGCAGAPDARRGAPAAVALFDEASTKAWWASSPAA